MAMSRSTATGDLNETSRLDRDADVLVVVVSCSLVTLAILSVAATSQCLNGDLTLDKTLCHVVRRSLDTPPKRRKRGLTKKADRAARRGASE